MELQYTGAPFFLKKGKKLKKIKLVFLALAAAFFMMGCDTASNEAQSFFGTKAPSEEKVKGDIVFSDGSSTPIGENLSLSDGQKGAAVGVVIEYGGKKLLIGFVSEDKYLWCTEDANFYGETSGKLTRDCDGRLAAQYIREAVIAIGKTDDTYCGSDKYPAFEYCWNYSKGIYDKGWYLASYEEIVQLSETANKNNVDNFYTLLEKQNPKSVALWTSQVSGTESSWFKEGGSGGAVSRTSNRNYVLPVYNLSSEKQIHKVSLKYNNGTNDKLEFVYADNCEFDVKNAIETLKTKASLADKNVVCLSTAASGKQNPMTEGKVNITSDTEYYAGWYFGEKLNIPENRFVGDIVFSDGSLTPYSSTAELTLSQKDAAEGVIFFSDEGKNNGTKYDGTDIDYSRKKIFVQGISDTYTGTRVLLKNRSGTGYYYTQNGDVLCPGERGNPNNVGLDAYFQGQSQTDYRPIMNTSTKFDFSDGSGNKSVYSLLDGSKALSILNEKGVSLENSLIFKNLGTERYIPSIMELQIIYLYKDTIEKQLKKIGSNITFTYSNGRSEIYWSCNSFGGGHPKPSDTKNYAVAIKFSESATTATAAIQVMENKTSNKIMYCKEIK